ncbi:hypothetical protein RND81_11G090300 [Saponaria officinalis]|uniref:Steroid nuclear receptor ligand-binding n=1 Tax=Saponaria officinalis TaxID=3572 RepID=A0AAW1HK63_SAPOF
MKVPVGFFAKLWSFMRFLPLFLLLFVFGNLKGLIIAPITCCIIGLGNSSVIIGLWPAHFIWTCYCVCTTKKLGMTVKVLLLLGLPVPLLIWPIVSVAGSFLGGVAFGYFAPLLATFEAVGENVADKFYHCIIDGCFSTLQEACTTVRDFTDFCFHSYFLYMDELRLQKPPDEEPMYINLLRLPGCLLVAVLAVLVDVPSITVLALWKSPYMLFTGWKRLLEDLVGREGPFLETVCVPFAGLAIILWPLAVISSVIASLVSSFFLGLYAGVIVHQEDSVRMGLAFIVAVVSLFDEYANDLLYLEEGSRIPRPRYRKKIPSADGIQKSTSYDSRDTAEKDGRERPSESKLVSERSRTLKGALHHYKPLKVLDWLFKSCEVNGMKLVQEGLINAKDIEDCVVKGDCKKLGIALPSWCIMKCLLVSAKSDSPGLVVSDEAEIMVKNWPRDKMFNWFIGPLLVMKEQISKLELTDDEEACLKVAIMQSKNERPEDWDEIGFPTKDHVKRAQLQSFIRRLQGIVGSLTRMPTFRRRFQNLVKVVYMEAAKTGTLANYVVESSNVKFGCQIENPEPSEVINAEKMMDDYVENIV